MRIEPEWAQSIADCYQHNAMSRQRLAIEHRGVRSITREIATSGNPNHHGFARRRRPVRDPDVQIQTVLAGQLRSLGRNERRLLRAYRTELRSVSNTGPRRDRLWFAPSQVAHRRRGKWNSLEHRSAPAERDTADLSTCDRDRWIRRSPAHPNCADHDAQSKNRSHHKV